MGSLSAVDSPLEYPKARRDESVVDYYHGLPVSDPYRWLENPDSEETKEFISKQKELTESMLKTCETREKLKERLKEVFEFERYRVPFRHGDKLFFFHNKGLQPQDALFVQDGLEGEPKVLLDPNKLSEDGTISLGVCAVSEDAKYMAYGLSTSGSDWITIKVMQIEDRVSLPDTLSWVKFSSIAWTHDSKGFFYSRYPAPKSEIVNAGTETKINLNHELYYHVLGTDQSQDILCWKDPEHPRYRFYPHVTHDGKYLLLEIGETCDEVNKLYFFDLSSLPPTGLSATLQNNNNNDNNRLLPFTKLVDNLDALYHYVTNDDTLFTFLTNTGAPKRKLVRVDIKQHPCVWTDVVPESDKDVLVSANAVCENKLIVCYLRDVKHVLQVRDLDTGALLHPVPMDIGTVRVSARRKDSVAFVGFTSFLTFNVVYKCELGGGGAPDMMIYREISVPKFDRSEFKVDQVNKTRSCFL